jgi:integrase
LPIREITPPILLSALNKIEQRKAFEVARRSLQVSSQILRYAVVTGRAERNITPDLRGALKPIKRGNFAAMEAKDLPEFIQKLERNEARVFPQTRLAVELMMLTFVRTSELIKAKWTEFDLEARMWVIPAERMKMRKDHMVPLSTQAMEILKQLKEMNPNREYVFPSLHEPRKHMSNNTILMVLDRMGYG